MVRDDCAPEKEIEFLVAIGTFETRIMKTIAAMRSRRRTSARVTADLPVRPPGAAVRVREVLFSDFGDVEELKRRCGLAPDSPENWERLWRRNPALAKMRCEPPMGWVLESGGKLVGYLGNISLLYRYGDRTLRAVAGCGFAVEPAYRALSFCLVASFYRQRGVDLYLTTTASEVVGKIARAFKSDPLPQADYEKVLFWILRPYPFARVVIEGLKLRASISRMGTPLASFVVEADKILRRRWPRRCSTCFTVSEISASDIGDDFQALWLEKLSERPELLLADRSPAALRWHFESCTDAATVRIFCCYKKGELLGYAVIRNERKQANGLRVSMIADMLAKQDDPIIVSQLWAAAYDHTKRAGSHILQVLGFPGCIRQLCWQWRPYLTIDPVLPFYYKAAEPMLHKTLSDGMAWYATGFDGDRTLS
jgi:hypothetical protein